MGQKVFWDFEVKKITEFQDKKKEKKWRKKKKKRFD